MKAPPMEFERLVQQMVDQYPSCVAAGSEWGRTLQQARAAKIDQREVAAEALRRLADRFRRQAERAAELALGS